MKKTTLKKATLKKSTKTFYVYCLYFVECLENPQKYILFYFILQNIMKSQSNYSNKEIFLFIKFIYMTLSRYFSRNKL